MLTSSGARTAAWTAVLFPSISRECLIMSILMGNCNKTTSWATYNVFNYSFIDVLHNYII